MTKILNKIYGLSGLQIVNPRRYWFWMGAALSLNVALQVLSAKEQKRLYEKYLS